ncbi:helix-turn-helix domain-containing protein [Runella sp.]|uniref:helix-turn-helix domain-containing protein n=1 Tax=Runella sp. TaxID=1960881 RepID=UPI003016BA07
MGLSPIGLVHTGPPMRFKRWESEKLSGLSDLPRSGRPAKLNEEQKKVVEFCKSGIIK